VESLSEQLERSAAAIRARTPRPPEVAVVLGSGLGAFADGLTNAVRIPYGEIPGFASSTVPGHEGALFLGDAGGVAVAALKGRVHLYEGHDAAAVVHPVRTLRWLGAKVAILTNAAGGLDPGVPPGSLYVLEDHLNLTGTSPLRGHNDERVGPRFPDMTAAYDPALRAAALEEAARLGTPLHRGVYAGLVGPSYETPAEIRMLRTLGAHLVGMSTVLETLALRHMGARVLAFSCVTNLAAGLGDEPLTHEDVQEVATRARSSFARLLGAVIARTGGSA
jgi:purine-nucleoside phosphorylase